MWTPYGGSVKEHCPQAKIVYDKFHIISAYGKVIDKVRRQEFHKASEQEKEILKGTKYLLLKNRENLKKNEPQRLNQLLSINRNLQITYILKEQLQALWNNSTISEMKVVLIQWYNLAKGSGIKILEKFANTLLSLSLTKQVF
jgi:transposase